MMGFPEAYSQMMAVNAFDAKIAALDAKVLLQRADLGDEIEEVCESPFRAFLGTIKPKQIYSFCALPAAYERLAAEDKVEAAVACTDMTDVQALADAACMEGSAWDLGLSESYAAAATFDKLEAVSNKRKLQCCTDIEEKQSWAAALPEAYFTMLKDDEFEAVLADADRHDLQSRRDAPEDIMEQQLWAAGLPKAFETYSCKEVALDGNQSEKRQKTIDEWARQVSECSTTVPDGSESPSMTF